MKIRLRLFLLFFLTISFGFLFTKSALADTVTLSGSVKDSSGTAIGGATVSVNDPNLDSTTTDPTTGNYSLTIPSGTYNVQVTPAAGSSFSSAIAYNQNISVNTTLNFILTPAGTASLSGHLYDESGNPLTNQTVSLLNVSGAQVTSSTTDSTGHYSLTASTATYTIRINGANSDFSQDIPLAYNIFINNYALNSDTQQDITLPVKKVSMHIQDPSANPISGVKITSSSVQLNLNLSLGDG